MEGKECRHCHKEGHFSKVCKSTTKKPIPTCKSDIKPKINHIENSSDDEYVFSLKEEKSRDLPKVSVKIEGVDVRMMIDSGASINILDERALKLITGQRKVKLCKTTTNIYTYGSKSSLAILEQFKSEIESKKKFTCAESFVVKGMNGSLMCYETAQELGLIKIQVNTITQSSQILDEFADRFSGIGKLKGFQVELHIDKSIKPITQPHRRIPFHIKKKVEQELQYLKENDIIEKVEGPTPWIFSIVAAPKPKQPDKVRLCVDMRQANRTIQRERHLMPTVDDMINDLDGSKSLFQTRFKCWVSSARISARIALHHNVFYSYRSSEI